MTTKKGMAAKRGMTAKSGDCLWDEEITGLYLQEDSHKNRFRYVAVGDTILQRQQALTGRTEIL